MVEQFREIITRYVPKEAILYCLKHREVHPFHFKITRERRSKIGDYRFNKKSGNHEISVNGNLNPYAFLITYLHEVAHLIHFKRCGNNHPPHGKTWKRIFKELMEPVLSEHIFPQEILAQLRKHMMNPKASSQSDPILAIRLREFDDHYPETVIYLEDLGEGDIFTMNGRTFTKVKKRRTRSLCREKKTGKQYLVSEMVQVRKVI